jgi:hypothetical protein
MTQCRECNKEFISYTPRQEFCNDYCRGAFHRRRYRQQAVEEAEDRREARLNGHGTEEERQKASEVLARIVAEAGSGKPKFVRRI